MAVAIYGKAPARGDFIDRRAPPDFAESWHAWCASGLTAAKDRLGGEFPQRYSHAPLWRYALAAGVCGQAPAVGVMSPSADSVGRFFPLAIFSCAKEACSPLECLAANSEWFESAEQLALDVFSGAPEVERFFDAADAMEEPHFEACGSPDDDGVVFSTASSGLAGLLSRTAGRKPMAAFWSVDGFTQERGGSSGALIMRDILPTDDDWAVLLGARTLADR